MAADPSGFRWPRKATAMLGTGATVAAASRVSGAGLVAAALVGGFVVVTVLVIALRMEHLPEIRTRSWSFSWISTRHQKRRRHPKRPD